MKRPEEVLKVAGYDLDTFQMPKTQGSYVSCIQVGSILYTAGHIPFNPDGQLVVGKVSLIIVD
jgi:enamine deaminase RidA (YjgF/YER057c/UK114 family)